MINTPDLLALTEAVLDGKEPHCAELVKQIRTEDGCGLVDAVRQARYALRELAAKDYPKSKALLEKMP